MPENRCKTCIHYIHPDGFADYVFYCDRLLKGPWTEWVDFVEDVASARVRPDECCEFWEVTR